MNRFLGLVGLLAILVLASCEAESVDNQDGPYTVATGTGSTGSTQGGKD